MTKRRSLLALLIAACVPIVTSAQTYDQNGNTKIAEPSFPLAAFTLSTVCATPTTPLSCASTSYSRIQLTGGASLVALQIAASMAGDTITVVSGNDGTNFLALPMTQPNNTGASASSTITSAGRYAANVADAGWVAVVLTAGSTAVTVTPYVSQKSLAGSSSSGGGGGGTYVAPTCPAAPSAPCVQVSGPVTVNTAPPYVAPTCAAAPNAPCVQLTGPVSATVNTAPPYVHPTCPAAPNAPCVQFTGPPITVNTAAPYVAPTCAAAPNAPCAQLTGSLPQPAATLPVTTPAPLATCPGVPNAPCVQISGVVTAHNDGSFPTPPAVQPVSGTVSAIVNTPAPCVTASDGGCNSHITNTPAPGPTSSPGNVPLEVPANPAGTPYSAANPQPVTTAAPPTTSSPYYDRLQDGTTTNLACILSDGALCIGTASTLVQLNPTVTASSAYSAGNCVGGLLAFGSAFRNPSNTGILESISISVKSTQSVSFKLYLFTANPSASTFNDKAAPAINSADIGKAVGVYTLAAYDNGLGTSTVYELDGIGKQITSSSATLYGVLVTTAAVTFASSSDVYVAVGVLQD